MKGYFLIPILCLSFLAFSQAENATELKLSSTLTLRLPSSSLTPYKIVVPSNISSPQHLYLHLQPSIADPLQVPYLTITSDNYYTQNCYASDEEFTGICKIDSKDLQEERVFTLWIKCMTECNLNFETYFSETVELSLGEELQLKTQSDGGLNISILVKIPSDATYDGISLIATIANIEQNLKLADQKLDMLVNYGDENVQSPTDQDAMAKGVAFFTGGKLVYLQDNQAGPGSWIKVELKLQQGVSIMFSASQDLSGQQTIKLGRSYFHFMNKTGQKIYSLDISDRLAELSDKTIEFVFDIYSGNPEIIIGFDRQFSNVIPYSRKSSAISYSFSPSLRSNYDFTGSIFIDVSATMPSEYNFYTKVIREDMTFVEPYLTYFDEIQQNQVENYITIERFVYEWGSDNTMAKYTFTIQTFQGQGNFYFKRFQTIKSQKAISQDLQSSLISDSTQLKTPDFAKDEIQTQQIANGNKITIQMDYDTVLCSELNRKKGKFYKECGFQIIAVGQSSEPFIFSLSFERKFDTTYLKQNSVVKDYIPKQSYVYYAFSLPSMADVTKIVIFATTLSGESALIVSTTQQFPTLESPIDEIQKSAGENSNVVLDATQLSPQIYISVYAYQSAQVSLRVVVHRKSDDDQNYNNIILENGALLTYTIDATQSSVSFKTNSLNSESIVVSLNELVGHCTFKVLDQSNNQVACIEKDDNPLICHVATTRNTEYRIEVTGESGKKNKFTISYKDSIVDCTSVLLNLPINVVLHASQSQCFTFAVNRNVDLKFVASFSHTQLFNKQIGVELYSGDSMLSSIEGTHYDIPVWKLIKNCPLGSKKPGFLKTCFVSIKFVSHSAKTSMFTFIVEEDDAEIALFDGIVEKVTDLQADVRKYFYYHLYSPATIKIFLTTQSFQMNYLLVAKLVTTQIFLKRNDEDVVNLYKEYSATKGEKKNTAANLFATSIKNVRTSIMSIEKEFIQTSCPVVQECYLLLSVAAGVGAVGGTSQFQDPVTYQIQIAQEETYLRLGDTKIGFIEQAQIYTYLIDPANAIVTLRNMNKETKHATQCARIFTTYSNGSLKHYNKLGSYIQFNKADKVDKIYVSGDAEQCSYQISYMSTLQPTTTVSLSTLYELNIQGAETERFLFYNSHPTSFRIMQMVSAGSADIHILSFDQNNLTLSQVAEMDYQEFPVADSVDGDFIVSSSSDYFCSQCFYYVVVSTKSKFIGEIVFLRPTDAVPLSVGHIFKETLSPLSEIKSQRYIFYSLTTFNIAFHMLSGRIQIHMTNPKNELVIQEIIGKSKTFRIDAVDYKSKEKIQFFSPKSMYQIRIVAVTEAQFYLRVARTRATERIFEGYPMTVRIENNKSTQIQFVNSQQLDKPLTVMVDYQGYPGQKAQISVEATALLDSGQQINSSQLLKNSIDSLNTYLVNLNNVKGTYFLIIQTDVSVNATLLLFKDSRTHITPSVNNLFNNEGIFELSSNQHNALVQIFNCKGDLQITASKNYEDITDPKVANSSLIKLRRPNYGGHYVFGVQDVAGSYFLKVDNKNKQNEVQYLINYYYYDQINPYDSIDVINYNVNYQLTQKGLNVSVNPPIILSDSSDQIKIKNISYWIYVSDTKQNLNRYSRCSIKDSIIEFSSNNSPQMSIESPLLSQLLNMNSEVKTLYINVEASVSIQIINQQTYEIDDYPTIITILYNTIQIQPKWIIDSKQAYWFTDNIFVFLGWMILPFVLAAIFLLSAIKYCLRKLIMRQKQMIEEVDGVGTSQTLPSEAGMKEGAAGALPDTALQNLKQHV